MTRPSAQLIIETVAAFFGIDAAALSIRRGTAELVAARDVAIWFVRHRTVLAAAEIGWLFGGRHATTVAAAWDRIDDRRSIDPAFAGELVEIGVMIDGALQAITRLGCGHRIDDIDVAEVAGRVIEGGAIHVPVTELRVLAAVASAAVAGRYAEQPHDQVVAAARLFVEAIDRLGDLHNTSPHRARFLRSAADSTLFELRQAVSRLPHSPNAYEEDHHEHANA